MKTALRFLMVFLLIIVLIGCYSKPMPIKELFGVELGMSKKEVKNILGMSEEEKEKIIAAAKGKNTRIYEILNQWSYNTEGFENNITIYFGEEEFVDNVYKITLAEDSKIDVGGIRIGDSESKVLKIYGQPEKKSIGFKALIYEYSAYNLAFAIDTISKKVKCIWVVEFGYVS